VSIKIGEERWFGRKYNGAPTEKMVGTNKNAEKALSAY